MNPLETINLALRIWLVILESTPAEIRTEQIREFWQFWQDLKGWLDKNAG